MRERRGFSFLFLSPKWPLARLRKGGGEKRERVSLVGKERKKGEGKGAYNDISIAGEGGGGRGRANTAVPHVHVKRGKEEQLLHRPTSLSSFPCPSGSFLYCLFSFLFLIPCCVYFSGKTTTDATVSLPPPSD